MPVAVGDDRRRGGRTDAGQGIEVALGRGVEIDWSGVASRPSRRLAPRRRGNGSPTIGTSTRSPSVTFAASASRFGSAPGRETAGRVDEIDHTRIVRQSIHARRHDRARGLHDDAVDRLDTGRGNWGPAAAAAAASGMSDSVGAGCAAPKRHDPAETEHGDETRDRDGETNGVSVRPPRGASTRARHDNGGGTGNKSDTASSTRTRTGRKSARRYLRTPGDPLGLDLEAGSGGTRPCAE